MRKIEKLKALAQEAKETLEDLLSEEQIKFITIGMLAALMHSKGDADVLAKDFAIITIKTMEKYPELDKDLITKVILYLYHKPDSVSEDEDDEEHIEDLEG